MQRDIGKYLVGGFARVPASITAAAGDDGAEVSGPWFDRLALGSLCLSVKVLIVWEAVLAATKTLTLTANVQDATKSDGTGSADYGDALAATVVATGPGGGGTKRGVTAFDVDLSEAREFIRLQVTADLSATATDTVAIAAVFVFGGADALPAA